MINLERGELKMSFYITLRCKVSLFIFCADSASAQKARQRGTPAQTSQHPKESMTCANLFP